MRRLLLLLSVLLFTSCTTVPKPVDVVVDSASKAGKLEVTVATIDETARTAQSITTEVGKAQNDIIDAVVSIKPGEFGDAEKEALTVKVVEQSKRIAVLESTIASLKSQSTAAVIGATDIRDSIIATKDAIENDAKRSGLRQLLDDIPGILLLIVACICWAAYFVNAILRRKP